MDGRDYRFLSRKEFLEGVEKRRFLEWAEVHGELYGTDGTAVEQWIRSGLDVLLDIDVQGARQVLITYPDATTIFILPPSMKALQDRLAKRGTESERQLRRRLETASAEMAQAPWYDYLVVNDDLDEAVLDFEAVLRASRSMRRHRSRELSALLKPGAPLQRP